MKLSSDDLAQLCKLAISAAYQAGLIISDYTNSTVSINTKTGGSSLASQVVTEVDYLSQNTILQILTPSCESFDIALLTEESPDNLERLNKDFFWCIDPLDGTLPFIESTSGYAVSIALVSKNGISHIGVVYDPIEKTLYHAIKEGGAFINNEPWQLPPEPPLPSQTLTFIYDRSSQQHIYFSNILDNLTHFANQQGYRGINTISHGGAVMNACWALENSPACYFKFPKPQNGGGSLWDYAATACIFQESATFVSDIFANPLDLNRSNSTFMNHNGVLFSTNKTLAKHIVNLFSQLHNH